MNRQMVLAALAMIGGCTTEPPAARFTEITADSGVNVWAGVEVTAPHSRDPGAISASERLLGTLAADIKSGKVRPANEVKYVQALIVVRSGQEREKVGTIRWPLQQFVNSGGSLDAADSAQLNDLGAGKTYCDDASHRERAFCELAAAGWR